MDKRVLAVVGVAALVAGALFAWSMYVPALPETAVTDAAIRSLRDEIGQSAARTDAIVESVRKEVTSIRGEVNSQVNSLPVDGVARGLNDELARFRGVAIGPARVDGP